MKKTSSDSKRLTQEAQLNALAKLADEQINTRDIPEQRDWSGAQRGVFYRPIKKQLTLRLDAEVIDWFKSQGKDSGGYQTRINDALRTYVSQHKK